DVLLKRFKDFISPFVDCWAYCLLKNHCHFIIKIKHVQEIETIVLERPIEERTVSQKQFLLDKERNTAIDVMLERQVNSFLVSYTNYIKNKYNRSGGLFQKPFKRVNIQGDGYLQQAIVYVNANAEKHMIVKDFATYPYSSYAAIIKNENSLVKQEEVLVFFESKDNFIKVHQEQVNYYYKTKWPASKIEVQ
ncbi:MAG: hypothetical protein SFU21_04290, partial [Flavihumibacter sp.]|nr:hypothetical protein [Flavihumibacter sp.]